jgi:endo-1,4-beta-D-glucanase Y
MKKLLTFCACTLASLPALGAGEARPFPQHTVYTAGTIKPTSSSQADLDESVLKFYRIWKAAYLRSTAGGSQRYVFCNAEKTFSPKSTRSVSEGHGYGMLALVLMAGADPQAHGDFDAMFRFFRAHPAQENAGLMAWRQVAKGPALVERGEEDRDSATDGDLDIACALLMADRQWGSKGEIDYRREAGKVLAAIRASETDPQRGIFTLGSWETDESSQWGGVRPSDFMPAHLKTFAAALGDPYWTRMADTSYRVLDGVVAAYSPRTGLVPDFIAWKAGVYRPAPPDFLEGPDDGFYGYNACRVPWRVGTDYLLSGDRRARAAIPRGSTPVTGSTASL